MEKKKNSKKMGITAKINFNKNIYFINDRDNKQLNLLDNSVKLEERKNNTDLKFIDNNTNKSILVEKKINNEKLTSFFENKYTIDKTNIINKKLIEKYCVTDKVPSNIFIQLIHNNEDLKKILILYINDVIYSLNNIIRNNDQEVITSIREDYSLKFNIKTNEDGKEYKEYYVAKKNGNRIGKSDLLIKIIKTIKYRKSIYGIDSNECSIFEYLKYISLLRNEIAHDVKLSVNKELLEEELNKYIYKYGKNFLKQSELNIGLIAKLYDTNKEEEVEKYYLYYLNQKDKNIGISIKKLMEIARDIYPSELDEKRNKKYNVLLRYHLFNYLDKNKDLLNRYIEFLKKSDLDKKDKIYENLVKEIGKDEFDRVKDVAHKINFKKKTTDKIYITIINNILKKRYTFNTFSLYIYSLTKFITIKETNILTSSLINKLEGMKDLLEVASKLGISVNEYFKDDVFSIDLNQIDNIIKELGIINASRKYVSIKEHDYTKDELIAATNIFYNELSDEELDELYEKQYNNKVHQKSRIKYPIKNFIRNNVIKSKEFNYIYRYIDTKKISKLLYNNPNLVKFLLSNFSESELQRYKECEVNEDTIASVTLNSIIHNLKNGNMEYSSNIKAYIKCLYFLVKNMININSYYFLALSFYFRDLRLLIDENISDDEFNSITKLKVNYNGRDFKHIFLVPTEQIRHQKDLEQSQMSINNLNEIIDNIGSTGQGNILNKYRNNIEHISINKLLCNTKFPNDFEYKNYFKIYHYVLQKELLNGEYSSAFLNKCKKDIEKYHKYSKNLLYALNSLFMYNYSRYKDISTEEIFIRKYNI